MTKWQPDEQQGGGWYSNAGSGWDDASGYDIPIDDDQHPYFSGASDAKQHVQQFGFLHSGQMSPKPYNERAKPNAAFETNNGTLWGGSSNSATVDSFDDDRPLLEELGINFDHIRQKTLAVLNPLMTADLSVLNDNDLSGPLVFCLMFGFSLLLHGKVHFGYTYGIGLLGCMAIYALLNLMSTSGISLTCAVSVLGYCLLPMSLLSLVAAVCSFKGAIGLCVAVAAVLWCSLSASKLFVTALSMEKQGILIAYPCSLFYGLFALMAIF